MRGEPSRDDAVAPHPPSASSPRWHGEKEKRRGALLRFVAVGTLNTALTYLVYLGFARFVHYQVAYAIAYVAGVLLQFPLHSRFVFRVPLRWSNLVGYPPIHVVMYSFGALLMHVLVARLGTEERLAPLIVIALGVPLSFALTRAWLVRGKRME